MYLLEPAYKMKDMILLMQHQNLAWIRLVESLSGETKISNINVNCIMPSIIDTERNTKAMPNADFSNWVKSKDLANVVLFLSSEEAMAIIGADIPTYGVG